MIISKDPRPIPDEDSANSGKRGSLTLTRSACERSTAHATRWRLRTPLEATSKARLGPRNARRHTGVHTREKETPPSIHRRCSTYKTPKNPPKKLREPRHDLQTGCVNEANAQEPDVLLRAAAAGNETHEVLPRAPQTDPARGEHNASTLSRLRATNTRAKSKTLSLGRRARGQHCRGGSLPSVSFRVHTTSAKVHTLVPKRTQEGQEQPEGPQEAQSRGAPRGATATEWSPETDQQLV